MPEKRKLKPWERFALWFLVTWAWCACASSKSSESHTDYTQQVKTVTDEGEWTVRTWEWGYPEEVPGPASIPNSAATPSRTAKPPSAGGTPSGLVPQPTGPDQPTLLRYTEEVHSPTKTTTASGTSLEADAESKSSFKFGLSLWTKLGIALALGLLGWLGWKFRRALLPRLFGG